MPAGRPLIFETPEDLQKAVDSYFAECDAGEEVEELTKRGELVKYCRKIPYTVEGLALHLDVDSTTVREYGKRDEYSPIITRAREKIYRSWISLGLTGQYNPKMVALCLAANFKPYNIRQQTDVTVDSVEDRLRRIKANRVLAIEHDDEDTLDAVIFNTESRQGTL